MRYALEILVIGKGNPKKYEEIHWAPRLKKDILVALCFFVATRRK